jgi:selenocysteine lyase/cysteine desulfurase
MLDVDHNIACRTGLHCAPLVHRQLGTEAIHGGVRFGIGPFNTEAHIDHAIEGVRSVAAFRAGKS